MDEKQKSRLKRPIYPMPDFVQEALEKNNLVEAYEMRPPYQQNDYIGWITRAKRDETRQKRLTQMLEELSRGDTYMNMPYRPRTHSTKADNSSQFTKNKRMPK